MNPSSTPFNRSTYQINLESVHWNSRGAGDELKQPGPHLVAERQNHSPVPWWGSEGELQIIIWSGSANIIQEYSPLNDNMVWMVVSFVDRVSLPVLQNTIYQSDHHLLNTTVVLTFCRFRPYKQLRTQHISVVQGIVLYVGERGGLVCGLTDWPWHQWSRCHTSEAQARPHQKSGRNHLFWWLDDEWWLTLMRLRGTSSLKPARN